MSCVKSGDRMVNSMDPDQTAGEQSDQGWHHLLLPSYANIYLKYLLHFMLYFFPGQYLEGYLYY